MSRIKVDGTHAVESLWEINENSTGTPSGWNDAEEHDISFSTTDMAPGDSLNWDFDIKLNADADANDILYFHVTDDTDNGVDCIICTNPADPTGTEITSQEVAPGGTETLYFYLELDEYTPADTYTITVSMEAS